MTKELFFISSQINCQMQGRYAETIGKILTGRDDRCEATF